MRWQLIAQIALWHQPFVGALLAQELHFTRQVVNLVLLPGDDLVELVEQILSEAGLYFQIDQALCRNSNGLV